MPMDIFSDTPLFFVLLHKIYGTFLSIMTKSYLLCTTDYSCFFLLGSI